VKRIISIAILILSTMQLIAQVEKISISLCDTIQLSLYREKFDSSNCKFEYYPEQYLISINGLMAFGTDGNNPKYKLSRAVLIKGKSIYNLQVDNMYNPWFGEKANEKLFKAELDGTNLIIRGLFSDGAGSYGAEWLIAGNTCTRTILSRDEKIIIEYFDF